MSTFGLPIADFPETRHGHDVRLHTIYLGNLGLRGQFHVGWRYTADLGWNCGVSILRPRLTFHDINSQLIAYASSLSFHLFDCPLIAPSPKTHLHDINIDRWKYEKKSWSEHSQATPCTARPQHKTPNTLFNILCTTLKDGWMICVRESLQTLQASTKGHRQVCRWSSFA